ncbi:MAG: hypothetical protein JSW54_12865 [Fidelibacterota bacterium]|nr:MAG: hypothetical protein JSW54_12865 [Candidatus Neomarinimicrobiota bacterium]
MIRRIQPVLFLILPFCLLGQAKYAGELFEFPGDARSTGMGGAGVSSLHGAATGFYNPALVGQPHAPGIMLAHREQFGGVVSADLLAVCISHSSRLAFQLGVVRRGVDHIPDTRLALDDLNGNGILDDDERLAPERISYFNQREWGVLLSVARKDQSGWHWGGNAKLVGHWLGDDLGLGLGFDLGVWRTLGSALAYGLMLQDITTTQVFWSTGHRETIVPRLTTGLRWDFTLPLVRRVVAVEGELTSRLDGRRMERAFDIGRMSFLSKLGLELALNENLSIRGGSSTIYPLSLGAGLRFPAFSVDYAYIGDTGAQVFDPTHQLSVTLFIEALRAFLEAD